MRKQTQSEFIEKANIVHNNQYDYSKVEYKNCDTKIEIRCRKHDVTFLQTPWNHTNGFSKCPKCKVEKQKETFLKTLGVDNPMKLPELSQQARNTKKLRYGDDWSGIQKSRDTLFKRYGVRFNSQIPEVFARQQAKQNFTKIYTFPSGKTFNVQGYEPLAIDLLLSQGYAENDIQLLNRPSIKYVSAHGVDKTYHPDIIILSEHRIIEVKSTYTVTLDANLPYKKLACEEQGWKFNLWVFDNKHTLVSNIIARAYRILSL